MRDESNYYCGCPAVMIIVGGGQQHGQGGDDLGCGVRVSVPVIIESAERWPNMCVVIM